MREPLISGDEQDAVTRWRRFLSWRVGERAKIKRKIRRRERHKAKREARGQVAEHDGP